VIEQVTMPRSSGTREQVPMRILLKSVLLLVAAGAVALVGFAIFSELPAPVREVSLPIAVQ
jgi:hypothetical protein